MSRWRNADEVFAYLESFTNLERGAFNPREYRLERMERMLAEFGDPQGAYRVIHVAGSKGKGSVCAFAASCCVAMGERVGVYMSPHVSDYRERIRLIGGGTTQSQCDGLIVECGERIAEYVDRLRERDSDETLPTTFELLTLLGFLVFAAAECTVAVIEVGLGGRLDATNLVSPVVSVITGIELEHTDYLGETLDSVAGEKAGIIKPGVPVVMAEQPEEAREVLCRIASERDAPFARFNESVEVKIGGTSDTGTEVAMRFSDGLELRSRLRLLGAVQAANAGLALMAVRTMYPNIRAETLAAGLANAWLPGRAELWPGTPRILMDGAHTPESVRTVLRIAEDLQPDKDLRVLVFGSVKGKRHRTMLQSLVSQFRKIIISRPGTFKESDTDELLEMGLSVGGDCTKIDDIDAARRLLEGQDGGLVVVTGSFHLVGEARRVLVAEEMDREPTSK